ncbi:MAG: hypothetical protein NT051_01220, partial [Candidatus Micrarchaeota archaeon]|nr:hypothetical protein [Candidatus Micrarchaeota archaeon]
FTAANAAFLLSVDAQYVGLGGRAPDLDVGFETTSTCLSSLPKLEKTRENFHWATGADLRRIWAKNKLNLSSEARPDQSGYLTLRDLYFAYGWCQISDSLGAQAGEIGGTAVDESKLKSLSDRKLSAASKLMGESPAINYDALWHLQNGFDANQSGNFGAAIYEATYAQTMQSITNDESSLNISALAEKAAEGSRTSLWGKIYFAQGKYLYSEAKDGGFLPSDAYTILKYSSELDKAAAEIDSALLSDSQSGALPGANPQATANASSQGDAQQGTGSKKDDALVGGILTLFFIAACAMIAFSFWKKERWNP